MVVPCIWYLKDELRTSPIDSSILRYLKEKSLTILERKMELQDFHFAAAMLNPNYRTLRRATKAEQVQAQKYVKKRLETVMKLTDISAPVDDNSSDDNNDEVHHYLLKYEDDPRTSRKQDEISQYLKLEHRETSANDLFGFWKAIANTLPNLSKVAAQILNIPATSANVERSFSVAEQIISERRSSISPDLVDDILFLRSAKK